MRTASAWRCAVAAVTRPAGNSTTNAGEPGKWRRCQRVAASGRGGQAGDRASRSAGHSASAPRRAGRSRRPVSSGWWYQSVSAGPDPENQRAASRGSPARRAAAAPSSSRPAARRCASTPRGSCGSGRRRGRSVAAAATRPSGFTVGTSQRWSRRRSGRRRSCADDGEAGGLAAVDHADDERRSGPRIAARVVARSGRPCTEWPIVIAC